GWAGPPHVAPMERSRLLTHGFATASAAIGFILEPIPVVDEVLVIPLQYVLAASIARSRHQSLSKVPWVGASLIIWGGAVFRELLPETFLRPLPLVGPAVNGLLMFLN